MRRIKRMRVSPELFIGMFQAGEKKGYTVISDALPEDATLVGVQLDGLTAMLELIILSEEFDEVPVSRDIPIIQPVMETTSAERDRS